MLSFKSLKNIQALRTQKMIREQMQKQDFFDHLLTKITQQFTPAEYQYLINFVIPRKSETRDRKKQQMHANNTYLALENKENNFVFEPTYSNTPKTNNEKRYKKLKTERSEYLERTPKHYFTESIQNMKRSPDFAKTTYSTQHKTKVTTSFSAKKTISRNFKQISLLGRETEALNNSCQYKISKRSKKAIQENLLAKENITRLYDQKFLRSIMKTQTFQDQAQQADTFDLEQRPSIRKTHNPTTEFWQKQKEKEKKYRNFTSIKFQNSTKIARFGTRIFTRKF